MTRLAARISWLSIVLAFVGIALEGWVPDAGVLVLLFLVAYALSVSAAGPPWPVAFVAPLTAPWQLSVREWTGWPQRVLVWVERVVIAVALACVLVRWLT